MKISAVPVVYLCGGINGLSDAACKYWRECANKTLLYATLDPMRRDYRGVEDQSVNEIVTGDLDDIENSTILLVNATIPSWGTAMEIVYAFGLGKKIIAFVGNTSRISPWLRYHCSRIVESVEDAVTVINSGVL